MVDNSAGTINVPVLLGGPSGAASGSPVSVPYTTHNGSAAAGTDYTSTSGTLVFPAGETAENITVPILHRSGPAQARSFSVTLGTPTHATVADGTGVVTIEASGATPVSSPGILAPPDVIVGASDGYIDLPVTLTAPGTSPVTVYYDHPGRHDLVAHRLLRHQLRLRRPGRHPHLPARCHQPDHPDPAAELRPDGEWNVLPEPLQQQP